MEGGGDAATKRPLLQDEMGDGAEGHVAAESLSALANRGRRQQHQSTSSDHYALLQDGPCTEDVVEETSVSPVLFYECEEEVHGEDAPVAAAAAAHAPAPRPAADSAAGFGGTAASANSHPQQQPVRASAQLPPRAVARAAPPAPEGESTAGSALTAALQVAAAAARTLQLKPTTGDPPLSGSGRDAQRSPPATSMEMSDRSAVASGGGAPATGTAAASSASAAPHDGATSASIEMRNVADSTDASAAAPQLYSQEYERTCFICLGEAEPNNPLVSCCSTCYASTHLRCWREWRNNQRITTLRSRLLGLRTQTNHLLRCTICKSGTSVVAGEEDRLEWINELLFGGDGDSARTVPLIGGQRRDDDEDGEGQLLDIADIRTCVALVIYLALLVVVLMVACVVIVGRRFYAGDVILCCVIAVYELSVLLIAVLAVVRRRGAMVASASPERGFGSGGSSARSSRAAAISPESSAAAAAAAFGV